MDRTGKTFISLVGALVAGYSRIVFTREVEQVGKDMGFLKGTVGDKFYPFMRPFFDNIEVIEQYAKRDLKERVSMEPSQFMRGANLVDTLLIVDEAQNCDLATLKMAISRVGEGSKVVLCGSLNQIDRKEGDKEHNGLLTVIERFTGQSCFSHIHLVKDERSKLARLADELL
jgi:PhoH-like ATPase